MSSWRLQRGTITAVDSEGSSQEVGQGGEPLPPVLEERMRSSEGSGYSRASGSGSIQRQAIKEQLRGIHSTLDALAPSPPPKMPTAPAASSTSLNPLLEDISHRLVALEGLFARVDGRLVDHERTVRDLQHISAGAVTETARLVEYVGQSAGGGVRLSSPSVGRSPSSMLGRAPRLESAGASSLQISGTLNQHASQIHKLIAGLDFLEQHIIRQDQVIEGMQKHLQTAHTSRSRSPSELSIQVHDMSELLSRLRSHLYKVEKKTVSSETAAADAAARINDLCARMEVLESSFHPSSPKREHGAQNNPLFASSPPEASARSVTSDFVPRAEFDALRELVMRSLSQPTLDAVLPQAQAAEAAASDARVIAEQTAAELQEVRQQVGGLADSVDERLSHLSQQVTSAHEAAAAREAEDREREEQDVAADKAAVLALAAEVERAKAVMAQMMQELEEVRTTLAAASERDAADPPARASQLLAAIEAQQSASRDTLSALGSQLAALQAEDRNAGLEELKADLRARVDGVLQKIKERVQENSEAMVQKVESVRQGTHDQMREAVAETEAGLRLLLKQHADEVTANLEDLRSAVQDVQQQGCDVGTLKLHLTEMGVMQQSTKECVDAITSQIVDLADRVDAASNTEGIQQLRSELMELRSALGQQFVALEDQVHELSAEGERCRAYLEQTVTRSALADEMAAAMKETLENVDRLQELVERDCITREQLSNIFAAREEIHHAVGKLQNLFSTGKIDKDTMAAVESTIARSGSGVPARTVAAVEELQAKQADMAEKMNEIVFRVEQAAKQDQLHGLRQTMVGLEVELKRTQQAWAESAAPEPQTLSAAVARAEAAALAAEQAAATATEAACAEKTMGFTAPGTAELEMDVKELQASVEMLRGQVLELEGQVRAASRTTEASTEEVLTEFGGADVLKPAEASSVGAELVEAAAASASAALSGVQEVAAGMDLLRSQILELEAQVRAGAGDTADLRQHMEHLAEEQASGFAHLRQQLESEQAQQMLVYSSSVPSNASIKALEQEVQAVAGQASCAMESAHAAAAQAANAERAVTEVEQAIELLRAQMQELDNQVRAASCSAAEASADNAEQAGAAPMEACGCQCDPAVVETLAQRVDAMGADLQLQVDRLASELSAVAAATAVAGTSASVAELQQQVDRLAAELSSVAAVADGAATSTAVSQLQQCVDSLTSELSSVAAVADGGATSTAVSQLQQCVDSLTSELSSVAAVADAAATAATTAMTTAPQKPLPMPSATSLTLPAGTGPGPRAAQVQFLHRLAEVVRRQSARMKGQYGESTDAVTALEGVEQQLLDAEKSIDAIPSADPDAQTSGYAEAMVMILEQVATLRTIGSQTHPAIHEMLQLHEHQLTELAARVQHLQVAGANGCASSTAASSCDGSGADGVISLSARVAQLQQQLEALASGAGVRATVADGNGVVVSPTADIKALETKVQEYGKVLQAMRNRIVALQEYVDSTQGMVKEMHTANGTMLVRLTALEEASGAGATGGVDPVAVRKIVQEEVTQIEPRLRALEASAASAASTESLTKSFVMRLDEHDGRSAELAGKLAAVGQTMPVLAGQIKSVEKRLQERLQVAHNAWQELAFQLVEVTRIEKPNAKNPFLAIAPAGSNPAVLLLETKMEAMRKAMYQSTMLMVEDLKSEVKSRRPSDVGQ